MADEEAKQNIRSNNLVIRATTQIMDTLRSYPNPKGLEAFSIATMKLLEAIKPEFIAKFGAEEWQRQYDRANRNSTDMKLDKLKKLEATTTKLSDRTKQFRIKEKKRQVEYFEELERKNPNDLTVQNKLERLRVELAEVKKVESDGADKI
ncbi:hypothetical protein HXY33_05480 [Candidatus Bathyarchaeota archaeon]|nr:hypothetical protein [Candidatus Bathyarchaeota archaeon]